jgi:iron(III) transport system ATP-binding protein
VGHTYGSQRVLQAIDLELASGELLCVLGPSGSGKSTLLKLVAGLEPLLEGSIQFDQTEVTPADCPRPEDRPIGLVFQEHALFPHMTVKQNLEFGLNKLDATQAKQRVNALLHQVELDALKDRLPSTLSGGQQQRVALARALAPQPEVLLLDEPFASVDVLLKNRLREDMRAMLKALGINALLVTHDPDDALMVADRIAVIVAGKLVQVGTPAELWHDPAHPFVAEMFARQRILPGEVAADKVVTAFGEFTGVSLEHVTGKEVLLAVDPARVEIRGDAASEIKIVDIRFAGNFYQLVLESDAQQLVVHCASLPELKVGETVNVSVAPESLRAYNRE